MKSEELFKLKAAWLSAMANDRRLLILDLLMEREASVGDISDHVGLSQSAISQHLRLFRANKMVKTRRSAQNVFYSEPSDGVLKVLALLSEIFDE